MMSLKQYLAIKQLISNWVQNTQAANRAAHMLGSHVMVTHVQTSIQNFKQYNIHP